MENMDSQTNVFQFVGLQQQLHRLRLLFQSLHLKLRTQAKSRARAFSLYLKEVTLSIFQNKCIWCQLFISGWTTSCQRSKNIKFQSKAILNTCNQIEPYLFSLKILILKRQNISLNFCVTIQGFTTTSHFTKMLLAPFHSS